MRLSLVIFTLAAIAVMLVHVRRAETSANHQIQQLQMEQIYLQRKLCDQQATMSRLMSIGELRQRAEKLELHLTSRVVAPPPVTHRLAAEERPPCGQESQN